MKVGIITDSNSGITLEDAKIFDIGLVCMPFLIDGKEYFEHKSLSQEEFYKMLEKGADVSTSQPSVFDVRDVWEEKLKTYDEVVYIPMTSGLSNSCESAIKYAENYNGKVFVVDNKRISVTQKTAVYDAVRLAREGKSGKEIKDFLEKTSMQASIYIMVNTLKYLKKGGRITPAVAMLGTLLNIKPVLKIQGGKLDKFAQVMASSQGKKKMIEQIKKEITTRFSEEYKSGHLLVAMAYTKDEDRIEEFRKEMDKALQEFDLKVETVDPLALSIACHTGPGAIAVGLMYRY